MKVYVDENDIDLLDDLFEATNVYDCWDCNRDDALAIKSLADYTKKVRKEVVQELKQRLIEYTGFDEEYLKEHIYDADVGCILKQIDKFDRGE
jgi:hypothetical protein